MSVKIFLSTVSDEFRDYRDQLRRDLTRHNVEVKVQEDFKDYGTVTLDKLDLYIASCDAVVHLAGDMTGSAAKPESTKAILAKYPDLPDRLRPLSEALAKGIDISYTQWEAWLAIYHGKPLLIAQADISAPRAPEHAPTDTSRAAQREHLARLQEMERYPGSTFRNPDQLAKQIAYTTILDKLAEERTSASSRWPSQVSMIGIVGVLAAFLLVPLVAEQWSRLLGIGVAAPLALLVVFSTLSLALVHARYFGLLGAGNAPSGSLERKTYELLRANLATGGQVRRIYERWLTAFLDVADRFLGDAGMTNGALVLRAFSLRTSIPVWTAPAFDRCLLVALVYPVLTVYVLWVVSGRVGPAESALGLPSSLQAWQRYFPLTLFIVMITLHLLSLMDQIKGEFRLRTLIIAFIGLGTGGLLWFVGGFEFGVGRFVVFVFLPVASAAALGTVFGNAMGASALTVFFGVAFATSLSIPFPLNYILGAQLGIVIAAFGIFSEDLRLHGGFFVSFVATMLIAFLVVAVMPLSTWVQVGPIYFFIGFLTLLNAPFDWAALGLTRALLRRGLELGGWWPFLLALVDAIVAGIIIPLLALTMVLGVKIFDFMAVLGGHDPVLPLGPLLDGITAHPADPEYWWVYVLLLSTMIPSLFNLVIGGTALMRGLPGLSSFLLRFIPAGCAVPTYDRAWIATVLTAQVALGVVFGVAVQGLMVYALLSHVMPAAGLGLLDICRGLADWGGAA